MEDCDSALENTSSSRGNDTYSNLQTVLARAHTISQSKTSLQSSDQNRQYIKQFLWQEVDRHAVLLQQEFG